MEKRESEKGGRWKDRKSVEMEELEKMGGRINVVEWKEERKERQEKRNWENRQRNVKKRRKEKEKSRKEKGKAQEEVKWMMGKREMSGERIL